MQAKVRGYLDSEIQTGLKEKLYHANSHHKNKKVYTVSGKMILKQRQSARDEAHLMMKGPSTQEDATIT